MVAYGPCNPACKQNFWNMIDIGFKGAPTPRTIKGLEKQTSKNALTVDLSIVIGDSYFRPLLLHFTALNSDHRPLLLHTNPTKTSTLKSFRFESMWTRMSG